MIIYYFLQGLTIGLIAGGLTLAWHARRSILRGEPTEVAVRKARAGAVLGIMASMLAAVAYFLFLSER